MRYRYPMLQTEPLLRQTKPQTCYGIQFRYAELLILALSLGPLNSQLPTKSTPD